MSGQLTLVNSGFYLQGAVSGNVGGTLQLSGFVAGKPIFKVVGGSTVVSTTAASNTLTPQSQTTTYQNEGSNGTTTYTLPAPTPSQQINIGNNGSSDKLSILAPAGAKIRWSSVQLYGSITSAGNAADNATLIGESETVWRVVYVGESSQGSAWTPQP